MDRLFAALVITITMYLSRDARHPGVCSAPQAGGPLLGRAGQALQPLGRRPGGVHQVHNIASLFISSLRLHAEFICHIQEMLPYIR